MSPLAALLACFIYVAWLLWHEHRRRRGVSLSVYIVVGWLLLISSRPFMAWLGVVTGGGPHAAAYDEGSPFDAAVYLLLILCGLQTLRRRGVSFSRSAHANAWLFAFCAYWALSILWADLPLVAFKRWVKEAGNVVLVLVVLTEVDPYEAAKAVFVRCAALLMPLSGVLIRFFPDIGRTYHPWSGEMMYVGVATHKNSLGLLTLACGLFMLADVLDGRRRDDVVPPPGARLAELSLLALTAWLLMTSHSATSLLCGAIGAGLLLALRLSAARRHVVALQAAAVLGGGLLWMTDAAQALYSYVVVDVLGRDLTLTTRTDIWPLLLARVEDPLWGAGFNSFWSGERLAVLYERFGIIQAHNGYLETYLNGGLVGTVLLACVLLAALRSATLDVRAGGPRIGAVVLSLSVLAATIVGNLSEATFSKMNPLWFACLLCIVRPPGRALVVAPAGPALPHRPRADQPNTAR